MRREVCRSSREEEQRAVLKWIRLRPMGGDYHRLFSSRRMRKEDYGKVPSPAPCARRVCALRDNEERGVSKIRRMPLRVHGYDTQFVNMRVTAKQSDCDREERDKSSARLSF